MSRKFRLLLIPFILIMAVCFAVGCDSCNETPPPPEEVKNYQITLNFTELILDERSEDTLLTATVELEGEIVENPALTWTSGNINVVQVENGLVKVIGKGETTVVCSIEQSNAICKVTVEKYYEPEFKLIVEKNEFVIPEYQENYTFSVNASVVKDGAPVDVEIKYLSSNEVVATVDSNGKVTIKGEGKCYITVEATDGNNTVKAVITVYVGEVEAEKDANDVKVDDKIWFAEQLSPEELDVGASDKTWQSE